jgi:hypothetical protein
VGLHCGRGAEGGSWEGELERSKREGSRWGVGVFALWFEVRSQLGGRAREKPVGSK